MIVESDRNFESAEVAVGIALSAVLVADRGEKLEQELVKKSKSVSQPQQ